MKNIQISIMALVLITAVFSTIAPGCRMSSPDRIPTTEDSLMAAEHEERLANASGGNFNLSKEFFFKFISYREASYSDEHTVLLIYLKADSTEWDRLFSPRQPNDGLWTSRSYVTGYHSNDKVVNGDYGDVVIQDFNFDGKEDIALKSYDQDSTTFYNFFLRNDRGRFTKDDFLSDEISMVPLVYPKSKTLLVTKVPWRSRAEKGRYIFTEKGWEFVFTPGE